MLETIISSKTRIKLLLKFFLNAQSKSYLRGLAQEFGESTNAIRLELNKFESAGLLSSEFEGNKKVFRANEVHPLFENLHNLVVKYIGLDKIVEKITYRLGTVEKVFLVGDYAEGKDKGIIDLFILAETLNVNYLTGLLEKVESEIERKVRYVHFKNNVELQKLLSQRHHLLIWEQ